MRDYGTVCPAFWRGQTGKEIRAMGQAAQLVSVYLITAPDSNLIGLYYLPLLLLAHETNCTVEEARQVLTALADLHWAYYDLQTETVWIRNMAFYQVTEEVKPTDKRWPAIVRELASYDKSPFFRPFLDLYGEPFHLQGAFEPASETGASPSQGPSKGLRRAQRKRTQAPCKPLASPLQAPPDGLLDAGCAPEKPLGSPSDARSKEQRAEAKSKEQKQGAEAGGAPPNPPVLPACPLPEFLKQGMEAIGVVQEGTQLGLVEELGVDGLRCALAKLKLKGNGKNPAGLLMTHGQELAREGRALLQEAAQKALAGAPAALQDPRWSPLPEGLREDLEVQSAWATWIKAEAHLRDCPGDDLAPAAEKGARRPLLSILADRHPDRPGFRARLEQCTEQVARGGLTAPAVKLMAASLALGLVANQGRRT